MSKSLSIYITEDNKIVELGTNLYSPEFNSFFSHQGREFGPDYGIELPSSYHNEINKNYDNKCNFSVDNRDNIFSFNFSITRLKDNPYSWRVISRSMLYEYQLLNKFPSLTIEEILEKENIKEVKPDSTGTRRFTRLLDFTNNNSKYIQNLCDKSVIITKGD